MGGRLGREMDILGLDATGSEGSFLKGIENISQSHRSSDVEPFLGLFSSPNK
jgi:hypothetical protein